MMPGHIKTNTKSVVLVCHIANFHSGQREHGLLVVVWGGRLGFNAYAYMCGDLLVGFFMGLHIGSSDHWLSRKNFVPNADNFGKSYIKIGWKVFPRSFFRVPSGGGNKSSAYFVSFTIFHAYFTPKRDTSVILRIFHTYFQGFQDSSVVYLQKAGMTCQAGLRNITKKNGLVPKNAYLTHNLSPYIACFSTYFGI